MNYLKVQTDILKELYKVNRLYYIKEKDYIWVGADGFVAYRIPQDRFFLDVGNRSEARVLISHIEKIKEGETPTNVTKFKRPNITPNFCVEFSTDKFKVYADYKLIKPFESKKTELKFTVTSPIDAIGIWEDEELLGFIMPFRYNDNSEREDEVKYYE